MGSSSSDTPLKSVQDAKQKSRKWASIRSSQCIQNNELRAMFGGMMVNGEENRKKKKKSSRFLGLFAKERSFRRKETPVE